MIVMRVWVIMVLLWGTALTVVDAQVGSPEKKPASTDNVDFGDAFERLVKLGLPDTTGARYVKLTLQARSGEEEDANRYMNRRGRYSGGSSDVGAEGNAWLLPGNNEGVATLISQNYERVNVTRKAKRNNLLRALIGPEKPPKGGVTQGDWVGVDVAKDVKKIIAALAEMKGKDKAFDPDRWRYDTSAAVLGAEVLVRACQMYRAGFRDEANQLARTILSMVPEPVMIIDQVVDGIASRKYEVLVEAFFKTRDWKAYHEGLLKLTEQFPRGWKQQLAVRILLPKVERRLKGESARIVPLKGVAPNKEAVGIFDGFLERETPVVVNPKNCWLLHTAPAKAGEGAMNGAGYRTQYGGNQTTEEWLEKIYAMGLDGFIALTAFATDDNLIPVKMTEGSSSYYSRSYYSSSRDSIEEQALNEYQRMNRPCSRGEIARKIILATLPDPDNDLGSSSAAELRDIAYQWWREHRHDSVSTLARHFIRSGNSYQRSSAVTALIASGKDEDAGIVEEHILGADSVSKNMGNVDAYLKARKGKAREFFKKFSKALKDEMANGDGYSGSWQLRQSGGVDKYLKALSVYVDDVSPDKLLTEMRSGRESVKEGMPMLETAIGDGDRDPYIPQLVSLARKQKTLEDQLLVFNTMVSWKTRGYYNGNGRTETKVEKGHAAAVSAMIAKSKSDWKYFLGNKEKPAMPGDGKKLRGSPSLAHYAASAMEIIYFPEHMQTLQAISGYLTDEQQSEFALKRAEAMLEMGSEAPFPDAKNVTAPRRKEIRDKLAELDAKAVLAYQKTLSLDERLAWPEMMSGFAGNLPQGVADLSKMVVRMRWGNSGDLDGGVKGELNDLMLDKRLDQALVDGVLSWLLENAGKYPDLLFAVTAPGVPGQGMEARFWRGGSSSRWKQSLMSSGVEYLGSGKAELMAGISLNNSRSGDGPKGGALYKPDGKIESEAEAIKKTTEAIIAKVEKGEAVSFYFYAESSKNLKEQASKRGDEDGF